MTRIRFHECGPARQRGYAALLLVLLASIAVFAFTVAPQFHAAWEANLAVDAKEGEYLDTIAERLEQYYRQNAATLDRDPVPVLDQTTLLAAIGVQGKPTLHIVASNRLVGSTVNYRRIAVWLHNATPDTSTMNVTTGAFTPGANVKFRVVDGQRIQGQLYEDTLNGMKSFAGLLERRFRAKFESDPFRTLSINHFRPVSGTCTATADDMPCIATFTNVATAANWAQLLSQDPATLTTAWGDPFSVSNQLDSQTTAPPFSMAIRAPLPWGGTVLVNAIQPLN
jgi:hypothetical protein